MDKKENKVYSTFAVLFYINRQKVKKNGLCPLMGRISINAEIAQFSTGIDIDPALWDAKAYRISGRSRHAVEVNHRIESLTEKINQSYKEIVNQQGYITAELVKNAVRGIGSKKENLLVLFKEHNEEYARQIGINRAKRSLVPYLAVYKQVERFLRLHYGMEDIPLKKLELSFIEKFDSFLRIEQGFTAYTVSSYTILLKKIIRRAISKGILQRNPFAAYIPQQPARKRKHMTREELEKFMQVSIDSKQVCHTRDMFIFSTFTGLSYVDLCNLSQKNIHKGKGGNLWISIKRQKTGSQCNIPLLDIPRRIMEKYETERKGDKIFNMVVISCVEVNLGKISRLCGIEKKITFHMSRYNFGTLITLSEGVPLETVSQMMGHKSIRTTQIYSRMTGRKVNEDMNRLREKIGKKYKLPDSRSDKRQSGNSRNNGD